MPTFGAVLKLENPAKVPSFGARSRTAARDRPPLRHARLHMLRRMRSSAMKSRPASLHALKQHYTGKLRLSDVKEMFSSSHFGAEPAGRGATT
jgi:hypothetical protein